jgi:BioD-like phosphotransacetylase family protein
MKYEHDSMAHYGIPGQTWGVRNYQNPDGSLTPAGKDRYYKTGNDKKQKKTVEKVTGNSSTQGPGRAIKEAIFPKLKEKRLKKASEELEENGVRDRFNDKDLDHYSKLGNKRFREQVIKDMKKNPDLKYKQAYNKRLAKNIGLIIGASVAAKVAISYAYKKEPKIRKFMKNIGPTKVNLLNVVNRYSTMSNQRYNAVKDNKGGVHYGPAMKFS